MKIFTQLIRCAAMFTIVTRGGAANAQTPPEVLRQSLDGLTVAVAGDPTTHYTVALVDGTSTRQIQLPALADTISEARRWNNRVMILGALDHVSVIYVLGLETATVLDTFLGAQAAVSPDARYVAYRRPS